METGLQKKIVKLNGGLGNQMFQYALALVLAKKFHTKPALDFSWFDESKMQLEAIPRAFGLDVFNVDFELATTEDLAKIKRPMSGQKWKKSLMKMFPEKYGINYISEKYTYVFNENILNSSNYSYYEGYFQHEKYFKHLKPLILEAFSLKVQFDEKNRKILDKITQTNSVSLHIRRGDYVKLDFVNKMHGTCSLEYYERAIQHIAKEIRNPHFFIFSDDIPWVIENLKIEHPFTIVDFNQNQSWFDMELMKNCKHNIIANSSFSWWGAWLNTNPAKIVIAPKKWLAKKQKCEIVPKTWIKL